MPRTTGGRLMPDERISELDSLRESKKLSARTMKCLVGLGVTPELIQQAGRQAKQEIRAEAEAMRVKPADGPEGFARYTHFAHEANTQPLDAAERGTSKVEVGSVGSLSHSPQQS